MVVRFFDDFRPGPVPLNSSTRINEFRGFFSQFSINFNEILHTLFSIHVVTTMFREVLISIVEVRPFDM